MTLKELIKSLKNKKIMQDYKVIELYEPNEGEERVVDNAFATGDLLNIDEKLNFLSSAYIADVYNGTKFNHYLNRDVMRYKFISDYNYRNEFAEGGVSPVAEDEDDLLDTLVIVLEPERKIESNFKERNKMLRNRFMRDRLYNRKRVLSAHPFRRQYDKNRMNSPEHYQDYHDFVFYLTHPKVSGIITSFDSRDELLKFIDKYDNEYKLIDFLVELYRSTGDEFDSKLKEIAKLNNKDAFDFEISVQDNAPYGHFDIPVTWNYFTGKIVDFSIDKYNKYDYEVDDDFYIVRK